MKRFIAGFLSGAILFGGVFIVTAAPQTIQASFGVWKVVADGKPVEAETMIVNGTNYIPLRAVSTVLGKAVSADNNSKTVYIGTSPSQPSQPTSSIDIISVFPREADVILNSTVSIKVTGNSGAASARITDPSGAVVATQNNYETTSIGNRDFMLTFSPTSVGIYRAYVMDAAGTAAARSLEINIKQSITADVKSLSLSSNTVSLDNTVTVTVYTNTDASRVRLVSDNYSSDTVETTNYSTSGNERVFKLDWRVRGSYYSNLATVAAKVYALDNNGNPGGFRSMSVKIDDDAPVINDAYANKTEINAGTSTTLYVETGTNVTRVLFEITSGNGGLDSTSITSYKSQSGSRRYWENTFTAPSSSGTTKIKVTAESSSGSKAEKTLTITTSGSSSSGYSINSISQTPSSLSSTSGDWDVSIVVKTGPDTDKISYNVLYNNSSVKSNTVSGCDYESSSSKEWSFSFPATAENYSYYTISIYSYNTNGDSRSTTYQLK